MIVIPVPNTVKAYPARAFGASVPADKTIIDDAFIASLRHRAAEILRGRAVNVAHVPCAGCTLCCRGFWVALMPGDNPTLYKTVTIRGWKFLKRRPSGECVHLGRSGCKLHGKRPLPLACKAFDCRAVEEPKRYADPPRDAMDRFLSAVDHQGQRLGASGDADRNTRTGSAEIASEAAADKDEVHDR